MEKMKKKVGIGAEIPLSHIKNKKMINQHVYITIYAVCAKLLQLYPALCNPMDCSMPSFPELHYLPEFA